MELRLKAQEGLPPPPILLQPLLLAHMTMRQGGPQASPTQDCHLGLDSDATRADVHSHAMLPSHRFKSAYPSMSCPPRPHLGPLSHQLWAPAGASTLRVPQEEGIDPAALRVPSTLCRVTLGFLIPHCTVQSRPGLGTLSTCPKRWACPHLPHSQGRNPWGHFLHSPQGTETLELSLDHLAPVGPFLYCQQATTTEFHDRY